MSSATLADTDEPH